MAQYSQSTFVAVGATTSTVSIQHGKSGIDWIVWQMTVQSIPRRGSANVTVTRDGLYITSSLVVPSSAQGPPSIVLHTGSVLDTAFAGMLARDECLVTLLYEEVPWGQHGSQFGLV